MEAKISRMNERLGRMWKQCARQPFVMSMGLEEFPWVGVYAWFASEWSAGPTEAPRTDDSLFIAVRNVTLRHILVEVAFQSRIGLVSFPEFNNADGESVLEISAVPTMDRASIVTYYESKIIVDEDLNSDDIVDFRVSFRELNSSTPIRTVNQLLLIGSSAV